MRYRLLNILVILQLFTLTSVKGQNYTEYEVKAAYIYNFTKFINWPSGSFDNSSSPFVLGIYGKDPFGSILQRIIGNRKSNGRAWVIKYYSNPEQITNCNILFISNISPSKLNRVIQHVKLLPVLTVGDNLPEFCQHGGIINFTSKKSPKRFEINNNAAKNKHISISSRLLMLAKVISDNEVKF